MNTTLTVDKAGRVVLPKPVRDELQLTAGDSLELESSEDQIVLRPVRVASGVRRKQGVWVLDVDGPISAASVERTMQNIRRERENSWLDPKETARGSGRVRKSER
jgi:AbrB family looped-hinge helix DNA binding protein